MADEMKKVEKMLESHPSLKITTTKQGKCRVLCELSSHEMPCTVKDIEMYINGKKYKYESENRLTAKEQELHTQYLILKRRGQLYCTLTKRYINNFPHHIKMHFNGKRFQKAYNRNVKNLNSSEEKPLDKGPESEKDVAMWVPSESESESESAENEELGSDFEEDKKEETEQDYSFEILDVKNTSVDLQTLDTKSEQKKSKNKKAMKRSRKHLKEPIKKVDAEQKATKTKQGKKRKLAQ